MKWLLILMVVSAASIAASKESKSLALRDKKEKSEVKHTVTLAGSSLVSLDRPTPRTEEMMKEGAFQGHSTVGSGSGLVGE